jgi:peptide/nickel transport system substrate-binding protein
MINRKFGTGLVAGIVLLAWGSFSFAQTIPEVPREKTLILENIDGRVPVPDNMNPFITGQYLDWGMWQAVSESLFYLNLETGKLEPWLAESGEYSNNGKTVTIKLRKGAKWADGVDFTADDVKFTIDMLKANPKLMYSGEMNLWVESVTAGDPLTVRIELKSPNPRFLVDYFGVRIWETVLIVPKHIWEGQDPATFTNFDLESVLVLTSSSDRRKPRQYLTGSPNGGVRKLVSKICRHPNASYGSPLRRKMCALLRQ